METPENSGVFPRPGCGVVHPWCRFWTSVVGVVHKSSQVPDVIWGSVSILARPSLRRMRTLLVSVCSPLRSRLHYETLLGRARTNVFTPAVPEGPTRNRTRHVRSAGGAGTCAAAGMSGRSGAGAAQGLLTSCVLGNNVQPNGCTKRTERSGGRPCVPRTGDVDPARHPAPDDRA